jgi:hypothetical protein
MPEQLSPQDLQDLQMIRQQMGNDHPTSAKIDALLSENHANNRQPTQLEKDRQGSNTEGQSGFGMNLLKSLGHAMAGIVSAPGAAVTALNNPATIPTAIASTVGNTMRNDQRRQDAGRSGAYRIAAIPSDVTGIGDAPAMEKAADTGNTSGIAGMATGSAIGNIAPVVAGPRLAKAFADRPKPVEIPPVESTSRSLASRLTPSAKEAPGVESNLANQIDTLKRNAPNGQISRKSGLLDLSKTAEQAAQGDKYLSDIIEPNKDLPIGDTGMTVGDAHARLAEVNDTLHPKYMRGGAGSPSAQAAIGAEQARSLEAEANQLRGGISETVGRKMGIDPDHVRGLRKNYEQLKDLGWRADVSDYAHQMGLQDPSLPTSRMGMVDRVASRLWNNPNHAVAKAFNNYEAAPPPEVPGYPLQGPGLMKPMVPRPIVNPDSGTTLELPARLPKGIDAGANNVLERAMQNDASKNSAMQSAESQRMTQNRNTAQHGEQGKVQKVEMNPRDTSAESREYLKNAAKRRNLRTKEQ